MNRSVILAGLTLGLAAVVGTAAPATGATQLKPKAGSYSGQEADGTALAPVSFTVSANHKKVVRFKAQAIAKAGCSNKLQSVQAPFNAVITNGHFTKTSTAYPQKGLRVTLTGNFVAAGKVNGHIAIHYTRGKGCNANRAFNAQWSAATA